MSQHEHAEQPLPHRAAASGPSPWSSRHRARRGLLPTTLLVGNPHGIGALHQQLRRQPLRGYRVIGCCLPSPGRVGETIEGLPVLGGSDDVVDVVWRYGVDTVAVIPSPAWDGAALRRLANDLEPTRAHLLLTPAGISAAADLPPSSWGDRGLHGVRALVKASFDRAAAALVLLLLTPVLLWVALGVKATSPGPVFVRLERVGRDGRPFHLLKFRTTEFGADRSRDHLPVRRGGVKVSEIHRAPRETLLGSLLRRYSIDELPKLLNVLKGDMSLVGPRPGLPSGMPGTGTTAPGRSLVKPGLTGLAQVSGEPGRSGDDGARIDADYVENWSLMLDLAILRKAFTAILRGDGAR